MAQQHNTPRRRSPDGTVTGQMVLRTQILWALIMVVGMGALILRLGYIQLADHEDMQTQTASQQLLDQSITPLRGNIYDATGSVLAKSSVVWRITVDPMELAKMYRRDKDGNLVNERVEPETVAADLAAILGVDEQELCEKLSDSDSQYKVLARQVDQPVRELVEEYAKSKRAVDSEGNVVDGYTRGRLPINVERDSRREYPYGNFMSTVLGFCNKEGKGAYGLEVQYEDVLAGTPGRTITLRSPLGDALPDDTATTYPAVDGSSLHLTIDVNVQAIAEKYLKNAVENHNVQQRAMAIVMDVNTGAIKAMAVEGGFDPNDPYTIYDEQLRGILEHEGYLTADQMYILRRRLGMQPRFPDPDHPDQLVPILEDGLIDDSEYSTVQGLMRYSQWKNDCITKPIYPGSVFKVVTSAAALDSGLATQYTSFNCYGAYQVADLSYGCASNSSHGEQDMAMALRNSCNIYYIQLGQRLGRSTFFDYFKAFGFTEATGIDLPGEARWIQYYDESSLGETQLASSSFGQAQKVTALQTLTAVCAAVNGGYLVQPHVVDTITDADGNLISTADTTTKRQVISEATSAQLRAMMETVVDDGTDRAPGRNTYVAGYRVGGKSGTSEKLDEASRPYGGYRFASSFVAVVPANDPEIAVLVVLDDPETDTDSSLYLSGPVAGNIISEVAPYLGIKTQYTEEELANTTVRVPWTLVGTEWSQAQVELNKLNLKHKTLENGSAVTHTYPEGGTYLPAGSTVYLYTESTEDILATVPDVTGRDAAFASTMLKAAGLNVQVVGTGAVTGQDAEPGTQTPMGTVVTITCGETEPPAPEG